MRVPVINILLSVTQLGPRFIGCEKLLRYYQCKRRSYLLWRGNSVFIINTLLFMWFFDCRPNPCGFFWVSQSFVSLFGTVTNSQDCYGPVPNMWASIKEKLARISLMNAEFVISTNVNVSFIVHFCFGKHSTYIYIYIYIYASIYIYICECVCVCVCVCECVIETNTYAGCVVLTLKFCDF